MIVDPMASLRPYRPRTLLAVLALCSIQLVAEAASPLPSYNIDASQTSISGLSSGAFMAVQMHVAYSATFRQGAGIVAGGPFYCAQGAISTALGPCMAATSTSKPATATLVSTTNNWASQGSIDPVSNLTNSRVYLYSGTADSTVRQAVMDEANTYYKNYVANGNVYYRNSVASEHAMITDSFGSGCSVKGSPYINNCNIDLAGDMLKWIYGTLNPRNTGTLGGSFIEFDQAAFIASPATHGVGATGWIYVPASCAANQLCKLHVVLHGCQQDTTKIGSQYYRETGYNKWADGNNIVVLYPQSAPSSSGNPNGCWDWWGYDDANYAKKSGRQMAAIKGMVDKLSSAYIALPAPSGLAVTATSDNSISLVWDAVATAASYDVVRGASKINGAPVTTTRYVDTGLSAGTAYTYQVTATTASGASSATSGAVTGTTTGSAPPLPAPSGVSAVVTSATAISLAWTPTQGATGYNVYRNGNRANAAVVTGTSFSDSGLAERTSYVYAVSAVNSAGESARSADVVVTTRSGFVCNAVVASNYAHVQAGRAHDSRGVAQANGSNQNMGLDNVFYMRTLAQTAPGYYVIGTCP